MKYHSIPSLISLIVCSSTPLIGCSYEPPQVNPASGGGGSSSSTSGGQGGSAGQGMGGQSSTGGQGGSGMCDPGTTATCPAYKGPLGTENVGACKAATNTCLMTGTWTGCVDEVLPVPEGCTGVDDTNCDGIKPCSGTPHQSSSIPASQTTRDDIILAMATAKGKLGQDGPVYAVGIRDALFNPSPANGLRVLFWYRDADGQIHDWSSKFNFAASGGINGAGASGVAVLPGSGQIIVTGVFFGGTLTIEGMPAMIATGASSFIARLSSAGAVLNATFTTGNGSLEATALAADKNGNVYIGGNYLGTPVIDKTPLPASVGQDGFVACLSSDGQYKWHQVFSGLGPQSVSAIASINDTDIVVATTFVEKMGVVSANDVATFDANTTPDILVSRLRSTDGVALWNTHVPTTGIVGNLEVGGLAADATTIAFAGRFGGEIKLAGTPYNNGDPTGAADSFIATLSTTDGTVMKHVASQAIGTQEIRSIALDSFGDIVVAGAFSNSLPLSGLTLQAAGAVDAFVAKVSPDLLNGRWAQKFGNDQYQGSQAVVVGKTTGHIFAGGGFFGNLDGVNPLLSSTGGLDAFLIELAN